MELMEELFFFFGNQNSIPHTRRGLTLLFELCSETAIRVRSGPGEVRRGNMSFLPPLEMRPSSIAPNPVAVAPDPAESRGAPPPPQDPSPLRGTLGSSLRSPAEGEGHAPPRHAHGDLTKGASEKSGILCSWEGPLGTPLGLVQWKRASSRVEAGNSCFLS